MFELAAAHVQQADREREIAANLRRRQLFEAREEATSSSRAELAPVPGARQAPER